LKADTHTLFFHLHLVAEINSKTCLCTSG